MRSRVVERFAERMFTWASESAIVMSESRRLRSMASTWMFTRNVDCAVGAHSTSSSLSGCDLSDAAFVQSRRCTETPPPLVTKPRIASGGTGVQRFGELDPDVRGPPHDDAGVAAHRGLRTHSAASDLHALGEVLLRPALAAVQDLDDAAYDGLGAQVALADGGVERGDVGRA